MMTTINQEDMEAILRKPILRLKDLGPEHEGKRFRFRDSDAACWFMGVIGNNLGPGEIRRRRAAVNAVGDLAYDGPSGMVNEIELLPDVGPPPWLAPTTKPQEEPVRRMPDCSSEGCATVALTSAEWTAEVSKRLAERAAARRLPVQTDEDPDTYNFLPALDGAEKLLPMELCDGYVKPKHSIEVHSDTTYSAGPIHVRPIEVSEISGRTQDITAPAPPEEHARPLTGLTPYTFKVYSRPPIGSREINGISHRAFLVKDIRDLMAFERTERIKAYGAWVSPDALILLSHILLSQVSPLAWSSIGKADLEYVFKHYHLLVFTPDL